MTSGTASRPLPGGRVYRGLLCCCPVHYWTVCSADSSRVSRVGAESSPSQSIFPRMTSGRPAPAETLPGSGAAPGHRFPGTPGPQDRGAGASLGVSGRAPGLTRASASLRAAPRGRQSPSRTLQLLGHRRDVGFCAVLILSVNHRHPGSKSLLLPDRRLRVSPVGKASAVPWEPRGQHGVVPSLSGPRAL